MKKENNSEVLDPEKISDAIRLACDRRLGVLDSHFMCQSIGSVPSKPPVRASKTDTVEHVLGLLRKNKTGCVVVVDSDGSIEGIFSERDFILKISEKFQERISAPISQFMTPEPMTVSAESTLAYALNLMSQGGFRHIPVVDSAGRPTAVISVKDVVDVIVGQFVSDVMALDVAEV